MACKIERHKIIPERTPNVTHHLIDLAACERTEGEIIILAAELNQRAEQGAHAAHHTAKLARRIADLADELGQSTASLRAT